MLSLAFFLSTNFFFFSGASPFRFLFSLTFCNAEEARKRGRWSPEPAPPLFVTSPPQSRLNGVRLDRAAEDGDRSSEELLLEEGKEQGRGTDRFVGRSSPPRVSAPWDDSLLVAGVWDETGATEEEREDKQRNQQQRQLAVESTTAEGTEKSLSREAMAAAAERQQLRQRQLKTTSPTSRSTPNPFGPAETREGERADEQENASRSIKHDVGLEKRKAKERKKNGGESREDALLMRLEGLRLSDLEGEEEQARDTARQPRQTTEGRKRSEKKDKKKESRRGPQSEAKVTSATASNDVGSEVERMKKQIKEMKRYVKALVNAERQREEKGGHFAGFSSRLAAKTGRPLTKELSRESLQRIERLTPTGVHLNVLSLKKKRQRRYPTVLEEKRRLLSVVPRGAPIRVPFEVAAVSVQSFVRGFLLRQRAKRAKAFIRGITVLQAVFRGRMARRRCPFRRQIERIFKQE